MSESLLNTTPVDFVSRTNLQVIGACSSSDGDESSSLASSLYGTRINEGSFVEISFDYSSSTDDEASRRRGMIPLVYNGRDRVFRLSSDAESTISSTSDDGSNLYPDTYFRCEEPQPKSYYTHKLPPSHRRIMSNESASSENSKRKIQNQKRDSRRGDALTPSAEKGAIAPTPEKNGSHGRVSFLALTLRPFQRKKGSTQLASAKVSSTSVESKVTGEAGESETEQRESHSSVFRPYSTLGSDIERAASSDLSVLSLEDGDCIEIWESEESGENSAEEEAGIRQVKVATPNMNDQRIVEPPAVERKTVCSFESLEDQVSPVLKKYPNKVKGKPKFIWKRDFMQSEDRPDSNGSEENSFESFSVGGDKDCSRTLDSGSWSCGSSFISLEANSNSRSSKSSMGGNSMEGARSLASGCWQEGTTPGAKPKVCIETEETSALGPGSWSSEESNEGWTDESSDSDEDNWSDALPVHEVIPQETLATGSPDRDCVVETIVSGTWTEEKVVTNIFSIQYPVARSKSHGSETSSMTSGDSRLYSVPSPFPAEPRGVYAPHSDDFVPEGLLYRTSSLEMVQVLKLGMRGHEAVRRLAAKSAETVSSVLKECPKKRSMPYFTIMGVSVPGYEAHVLQAVTIYRREVLNVSDKQYDGLKQQMNNESKDG